MTFTTSLRPKISGENSTTTPLTAGSTFTGTSEDVSSYKSISINVKSDADSSDSGLKVQFSPDEVNWDFQTVYKIFSNIATTETYLVRARYCRVIYINGSVDQTFLRLQTVFNPYKDPVIDANITNHDSVFDELKTVTRTPVISLKSNYGLSVLRDIIVEENGGKVKGVNSSVNPTDTGEFKLSTTNNGSSKAQLFSSERGVYQAGFSANIGIGIRIPVLPTGNQEMVWGYGEDPHTASTNGIYFGVNGSGIFVRIRRDGTNTDIYQTNWNVDSVDGNGTSEYVLDLTRGNIFSINFTWYGYGAIEFVVYNNIIDSTEKAKSRVVVHRFSPQGTTSLVNPNLPIITSVSNETATTGNDMFVGGRQFAIQGEYAQRFRITSEQKLLLTGVTTTIRPLISFRRKSGSVNLGGSVKLSGYDIITSGNILIQVRVNGSLTGASFGAITNTTPSETILESDTSATAITGGELVWSAIAVAAGGNNKENLAVGDIIRMDIPSTQPVTLCVRSFASTVDTSSIFRIREEW